MTAPSRTPIRLPVQIAAGLRQTAGYIVPRLTKVVPTSIFTGAALHFWISRSSCVRKNTAAGRKLSG